MMTDGGAQAGERLPTLVHVHRNVWEQVREERRQLREQVAALTAERDGLLADLIHFAQTNHQAHHTAHSGTWLSCDRGSCPGLRRAVSRARGATTPPSGAREGNDADR